MSPEPPPLERPHAEPSPSAPAWAYTVSVRELCEFTAKRGDLDRRFTPSATALKGLMGQGAVALGSANSRTQPTPAARVAGSPGRLNCRGWAASGRLKRLVTGRRPRRVLRLQTQMGEDPLDHRLLEDRRNDPQLTAAVRAVRRVEVKHAVDPGHVRIIN